MTRPNIDECLKQWTIDADGKGPFTVDNFFELFYPDYYVYKIAGGTSCIGSKAELHEELEA